MKVGAILLPLQQAPGDTAATKISHIFSSKEIITAVIGITWEDLKSSDVQIVPCAW
jgi:signal recognition particle receptor subunit beta